MARQTSTPLMPGIIKSVTTRSGVQSLKTCKPSSGSLAVRTSKPCAEREARSTRVICGSSSMTRILPGIFSSFQKRLHHPGWPSMIFGMKVMDGLSDSRGILHWFVGTLLAASATLLMVWLGANSTTAGMVFLVLVVWVSAQAGIRLSLFVALLCAIAFDYYFLPPVGTLRLSGIQSWVAMISFLLSCVVVGRVAERARGQARQADERREDLERLYELSQEMMLQEDAAGLIRDLPRMIEHIFALDGVVLYVRDQDEFYTSTAELPMSILAS